MTPTANIPFKPSHIAASPGRRHPLHRPRLAAAVLAAALLATGCGTPVVNPVSGQTERSVMDEASEVTEGRKAHAAILAETPAYANPAIQTYVDQLGQKLARQSHRSQLAWTFTVLDSPEINAFALPGGYVYVTRGIMAHLDSEAQLAGVIGHEIGHVTARHGAQRATRQQTAGIGVLLGTLAGVALEVAGVSGAAQAAGQLSQGIAAGRLASYSRDQELQADQLGAEYLVRNQFDPKNMVEVIGVLKNQERFAVDLAKAEGRPAPSGGGWLASHPSNDQRLADIRRIAATYPAAAFADEGRARYLRLVDGMGFGDSPAQGLVRGRQFFHDDLGIALAAPAGWLVDNGADAIRLISGAGDAALAVRLVPPSAGSNADEILRKLVASGDGRTERRNLNGLAATRFVGQRRNAQGQVQPVDILLVAGPGGHHYLVQRLGRDNAALQRAASALAEAEGSLRAMTAADRAAARPWVLKTVPVPRGGFAELARQSPLAVDGQAEARLRLLNGVYGSSVEPPPGTLVKVVQ